MSFLKRIFGMAEAGAAPKTPEATEKASMAGSDKIYPMLKPGSWDGFEHGVLKTTLSGNYGQPDVAISYGYDTPGSFVFLTPADLGKYTDEEIVSQAMSNLDEYPSAFEEFNAPEGRILTASGNALSSEKILCRDFMLEAHRMLGSDELLVSIPRRTCLMAISRNDSTELMAMFISLHEHMWQDDTYDNDPISNLLFVVIDGNIQGAVELD